LAKLDDAASIEEASVMLSGREKVAVLSHHAGFERLVRLAPELQ
jgi:protein subunit release factor B